MSADRAPGSEPFTVRCGKCDHVWIAAYYPAPLGRFASILRTATCPKCGNDAGEVFLNHPVEIGTCTECGDRALLCTEIKGAVYITVTCGCGEVLSIQGLPAYVSELRAAARGMWAKTGKASDPTAVRVCSSPAIFPEGTDG